MNTRRYSGYRVVVIGIGSAGCNGLQDLRRNLPSKPWWDLVWVACDSDVACLERLSDVVTLRLEGEGLAGMGCGGDPELGRVGAEGCLGSLREVLCGATLVLAIAGLGGGAGSGATPILLNTAREMGIATAALVSLPFKFEGPRRAQLASKALQVVRTAADFVSVTPNDQVVVAEPGLPVVKAMEAAMQHLMAPALALLHGTWEPGDDWSMASWEVGPQQAGTEAGATASVLTPNPSFVERKEIWKWRLLRYEGTPRAPEGIRFNATSLANGWIDQLCALGPSVAATGQSNGPFAITEATREALEIPLIRANASQSKAASLTLLTSLPDLGAVMKAADLVRSSIHPEGHVNVSVVWKSDVPPFATAWLLMGGMPVGLDAAPE